MLAAVMQYNPPRYQTLRKRVQAPPPSPSSGLSAAKTDVPGDLCDFLHATPAHCPLAAWYVVISKRRQMIELPSAGQCEAPFLTRVLFRKAFHREFALWLLHYIGHVCCSVSYLCLPKGCKNKGIIWRWQGRERDGGGRDAAAAGGRDDGAAAGPVCGAFSALQPALGGHRAGVIHPCHCGGRQIWHAAGPAEPGPFQFRILTSKCCEGLYSSPSWRQCVCNLMLGTVPYVWQPGFPLWVNTHNLYHWGMLRWISE